LIGIDTNVLLRWLLDDDPGQSELAAAAFDGDEQVFLGDIVLAEASWVMARSYRLSRHAIASALRHAIALPSVAVSDRAAVDAALTAYETGGPGLSDHLIGNLNSAAGCRTTLTFDKRAGDGNLFTSLA
jgi:predicted nucleic-acid-binding protein